METCDVLIVGGGPAGSSCAWKLWRSGLRVVILDKALFPRDKPCAGWITPPVLTDLEIDADDYRQGRVLQPITGFRIGVINGPQVDVRYRRAVSYGIRRCEFDTYLLNRSGARVVQQTAVTTIDRSAGSWVVNREFRSRIIVGAGGHFCPVAKMLGADIKAETSVVAQEAEFPAALSGCTVPPKAEMPELYFSRDLAGYGWRFSKCGFVNIGLGRLDHACLSKHVADFLAFLRAAGKLGDRLPQRLRGHAYLLRASSPRKIGGNNVLVTGDAAGLAYSKTGEGIYPAVFSGLAAAETIIAGGGELGAPALKAYAEALANLGPSAAESARNGITLVPSAVAAFIARQLMKSRRFVRRIVLDDWFLHTARECLHRQECHELS